MLLFLCQPIGFYVLTKKISIFFYVIFNFYLGNDNERLLNELCTLGEMVLESR